MTFKIIEDLIRLINKGYDPLKFCEGTFNAYVIDEQTISITDYDLILPNGDNLVYSMDYEQIHLNEWNVPNKDVDKLDTYLIEKMTEIVNRDLTTDLIGSYGYYEL